MQFCPLPPIRAKATQEPPYLVRHVSREDVLWDRPIFKAPPLKLDPKLIDARAVAEQFRRIGLGER